MSDLHSGCVVEIGACLLRGRTAAVVSAHGLYAKLTVSYVSVRPFNYGLVSAIIILSERSK
jgi:hypothetical protein